jgi:hypothetical protein
LSDGKEDVAQINFLCLELDVGDDVRVLSVTSESRGGVQQYVRKHPRLLGDNPTTTTASSRIWLNNEVRGGF